MTTRHAMNKVHKVNIPDWRSSALSFRHSWILAPCSMKSWTASSLLCLLLKTPHQWTPLYFCIHQPSRGPCLYNILSACDESKDASLRYKLCEERLLLGASGCQFVRLLICYLNTVLCFTSIWKKLSFTKIRQEKTFWCSLSFFKYWRLQGFDAIEERLHIISRLAS